MPSNQSLKLCETGLSLPDIALLQPMADILGVTVTELLRGEYIRGDATMTVEAVDKLVAGTLAMAAEEREQPRRGSRFWGICYTVSLVFGVLASVALWRMGTVVNEMVSVLLTPLILAAAFGAHACFYATERLPAFYDGNKISFYSDGMFRMNIPGVHFNNSNWPYILRTLRLWSVLMLALWPAVFWAGCAAAKVLLPSGWPLVMPMVLLAVLLAGLFLPLVIVGRKYQ